jgi:hypothetical protein
MVDVEMIRLTCSITVQGAVITATMQVPSEMYDDPAGRVSVERHLRFKLFEKVIDKFPPNISAERVSGPLWRAV